MYGKEDILLSAVNYEYVDSFNTYLQTRYRCKHNGAVNLLCCLKNFIFYCLRNEWITKNPFQNYKLKEEHNKAKDHLVKSEIDILIAKEMPNRRLEAVRDVFVFCSFTGLSYCDMCNLTASELTRGHEGNLWIETTRQKTGIPENVMLMDVAVKIIDKYKGLNSDGKVFSMMFNRSVNAHLKKIAKQCGIKRTLTFHVARHTFACLAMELSIPIDIIAKVLGHTNTNMTRRYAKLSETAIGREVSKIGEVFAQ